MISHSFLPLSGGRKDNQSATQARPEEAIPHRTPGPTTIKTAVKFIDPLSDFGFTYLFGSEPRKEFLISLLRATCGTHLEINDLFYQDNRRFNDAPKLSDSRFDIGCKSDKGEEFIIDMQWAYQKYFTEKAKYYTGLVSSSYEETGECNYALPGIHFVGIMDFSLAKTEQGGFLKIDCPRYDFPPFDISSKRNLKFYLQLPEFNLGPDQIKTDLQRWMYLFKNIASLTENPAFLTQPIFQKFLAIADISTLSKTDFNIYKNSLFQQQNEYAILQSARGEGRAVGSEEARAVGTGEGRMEAIKALLQSGDLSISEISKILGLDVDYIKKIDESMRLNEP